jgi:hypothetical protein
VKIFRHCLKHYLGKNERVEADDGYMGDDPRLVKTPRGIRYQEIDKKNFFFARNDARARQFHVLSDVFHHDVEKHSSSHSFHLSLDISNYTVSIYSLCPHAISLSMQKLVLAFACFLFSIIVKRNEIPSW